MLIRERKSSTIKNISGGNYFSSTSIYPKLTVNQPNDKYEKEADAMANQVMAMPETGIQRKCAECKEEEQLQTKSNLQRQEMEEEELLQTKPDLQRQEEEEEELQAKFEALQRQATLEEEEMLQTKSQGNGMQASSQLQDRLNASKGSGSPLPETINNFMGQAFGTDFSQVRVHTNSGANEMNQSIQAKAFTHGSDIYFRNGQFNPNTSTGKHLLAHELTHVIQQGKAKGAVQRASFGSGAAPHADYSVVPADERDRVNQSLAILKKIVDNPKSYPGCHQFFTDNTPGGAANSLKNVFGRANIWFDKDNSVYGSSVVADDLAYTSETWRWGKWSLAGTFIHEMMHLEGQDNESTNDKATKRCGLPDIAEYVRTRKNK